MNIRYLTISIVCLTALLFGSIPGSTNQAFALVDDWSPQTSGTDEILYGVSFVNSTHGWAVGTDGTIRVTANGGGDWGNQDSPLPTSHLYDVQIIDGYNGWAVGFAGRIISTTDGGGLWTTTLPAVTDEDLYGVSFVNSTHGWVVGADGVIRVTENGGGLWLPQTNPLGNTLLDVFFIDELNGWAVGVGQTILATTDGGGDWQIKNDGGVTPLQEVFFINPSKGWAVGNEGVILTTTNGGGSWSSDQDSGTVEILTDVFFIDENKGWIVGYGGTILTTTDGGDNWSSTPDSGTTKDLHRVSFVNENKGWAVGDLGTIRVGTGPIDDSETTTTSNGGGCDDCEPPTLGIDSKSKRLVHDGFTYNGKSVDVERFFTPYPQITVNVGEPNTAVFKIYEDKGPEKIKHFSFAFGLDKGQSIGESKAMIELDIDHEGTETVTVTDPENALDNIKVTTNIGNCNGNDSDMQCLIVTINHQFRAPLEFNIVATNVWDMKRNSWQNYYNHGIEVFGESLNPPAEYSGINKGHTYHLTQINSISAVDEFGNSWSFQYGVWEQDYIKHARVTDPPSDVMTRTHSEFAEYKELQAQNAIPQLLEICPSCLDSFTDFDDSFAYEFPIKLNKLDNPEIIQKMLLENKRAQKIMNKILYPISHLQH